MTDTETVAPSASDVTPEPIMRVASGFMAASHLFAANELGLFEALADSPATLDALAARTGLTTRAARISADAMVALGLLERRGDQYANTPATAAFLAGNSPSDLRPLLRFWGRISYPASMHYAAALASGPPTQVFDLDDDQQAIVSAGIEAATSGPANALPGVFDLTDRNRLLDIGGGTGSWSIAATRRYPHLRATVFELPVTADIARRHIANSGQGDQIDVLAGDVLADRLPEGYDAFLAANVAHYWNPADNQRLLDAVRRVAAPGGVLLLADFWTDTTHTEPLHAALMAGEFAVHVQDGDVYSVDEVRSWLTPLGWRFVAHHPLAGPQSVVVAEAV